MKDRRPCQGDAFVKAGPRLRRQDCENCASYKDRGGKCAGHRGWLLARYARIQLAGDPWREVRTDPGTTVVTDDDGEID